MLKLANNNDCVPKRFDCMVLLYFSDPMNNMCNPDPSTEGDVFTTSESISKPTEKTIRKPWTTSTHSTTSDEIPSNGHLSSTPVDVSIKKDLISDFYFSYSLFFKFF